MRLPRRALLAAPLATPAFAQAPWQPDRPIRVVVPLAPGGATDVWARLCLDPVSEILRVPIVIENRSGAGTMIGSDVVAKAAPDGHTLLFTLTTLVQAPIVLGNAPYDAVRDFTPIGMMGTTVLVFMARSNLGPRTMPEFIDFARARARAGRGLALGSYAAGSTGHVFGLLINEKLNLGMTHVAYRGEAPMVTAYLGGELDCGLNSLTICREHVNAGKLIPLAALGDTRPASMPNVPTFVEHGADIGRGWSGFVGLLGPARMPPHILARLEDAFRQSMARENVRNRLAQLDTEVIWQGSQEFGQTVVRSRDMWAELTRGVDLQL
ncbi:Bug family tripartite tricarboxylate transporter substrate binding protein [Rhodovarius crocodyli]|nr:tripartite tricarboxylate transporter substrate binding protein [Rhodovarius crocodyli]